MKRPKSGLAGGSACPTSACKRLSGGGAGAFACEPLFFTASHGRRPGTRPLPPAGHGLAQRPWWNVVEPQRAHLFHRVVVSPPRLHREIAIAQAVLAQHPHG